jgi:hypothetical protein
METIVECPGALDVHKAQVTACVRTPAPGGKARGAFLGVPTTVAGLLTLRDWLAAHGVTQVTMEATGVYCSPVRSKTKACSTLTGCRRRQTTECRSSWLGQTTGRR